MADFIKCLVYNFQPSEDLEFIRHVYENTGELSDWRHAKKDGLLIRVHDSGRTVLSGSLQKYGNSGIHNYDDFTRYKLDWTLQKLRKDGVQPDNCILQNIEFGVNIRIPCVTEDLVERVIMHKGTPFDKISVPGTGYAKEAKHSMLIVKVYDKGIQYNQGNNLLRFEIKFIKMQPLQKIGIYTLADAVKPESLKWFGEQLLLRWNECIIPWNPPEDKYLLPSFWKGLKKTTSRTNYKYHLDRILHFDQISGNNMKAIIHDLIREKWQMLMNPDDFFEDVPILRFDCLLIESKPKCKVTGLPIRGQRPDSKFLNIGGLRLLKAKDPERFKELYKRLDRSKFRNADEKTELKEIAHSIRNEYYNRIHNTKRSIERVLSAPTGHLFDPLAHIAPEKLKIAGILNQI